jgi:hypothetical protein
MATPQLKLVPQQQAAATWPDSNDVSDLLGIVQAQTVTIADQMDLLDRYQSILNAAQTMPPVATGLGTATGTSLVVTAVTGTIVIGAVVTGAGVPASPPKTTIVAQTAGTTGAAGTYTTSQATTVAASAPLAFKPPSSVSPWPLPRDQVTLNTLAQQQTAIMRTQSALIQHYQDVLNTSQTPAS